MELREMIQACVAGKRQAQHELYHRYAGQMMMVCLRYSSTRQDAEEIMQEGFVSAFQHIDQFRFTGSFEGWLRRIMVNTALQKLNTKKHLQTLSTTDINITDPMVPEEAVSQLSVKELLSLIQQLPKIYRLVFNLYVFEGYKHREISSMLGISAGSSKSNLHDARLLLQKAIHSNLYSRSQSNPLSAK